MHMSALAFKLSVFTSLMQITQKLFFWCDFFVSTTQIMLNTK